MWLYFQKTGNFTHSDAINKVVAIGYSGFGVYKNKSEFEDEENKGPIPRGIYIIGDANEHKGPLTLPLTPVKSNEMFGRSGFLIHGDSIEHPGAASEGCIILDKSTRQLLNLSIDKELIVI